MSAHRLAPGASRVPRSLVLVDGALTDADLVWIDRHLELCGTRGVREGREGDDISPNLVRARATGRRPAYLDRDPVDLDWIATVMIR